MKSALKVALTHDVDRVHKTYQYITYFIKALKSRDSRSVLYQMTSFLEKKTFWNFEKIIEFEDRCKVKSTFFFLNESVPFKLFQPSKWTLSLGRYNIESEEIVQVIQEIDTAGWEIGVHGSFLSYNNEKLLRHEKKVLARIVGHPVFGIRQHYLNLSSETWQLQKDIGFKYDTSLGFRNDIGFPQAKPFLPFNDNFVVFPLVIMDTFFMQYPSHNWKKFSELIQICKDNNSVIVLDWHNSVYHEREYPGYFDTYREIIKLLKKEGAHFDTLLNYYNHFEEYFIQ